MKQKLAIIGANAAITMLIRKAKSLGYETHVFAWKCGAPGETEADVFYPVDIARKEQVLDICRKIGVCGVISITSDFAAPIVNYVARNLGLNGNSERTDIVARNKYQMRCALKDAGLYTPLFLEAGKDFTPDQVKDFGYPLIVKPTDRWSSKGVTRVDREEDLMDAVHTAIQESFSHKAIVEQFMDGPEYSAECICFQGNAKVVAFTQKQTTGFPHYIETGHIQPSDIPMEQKEQISVKIIHALKALSIENSAAHAEFRILSNGEVGIIEIGARMGGDCIGTDLTCISTGMDFLHMVIDVACGRSPCMDIVTKPSPVWIKFIIQPSDLEEYERIQKEHPEMIVRADEFTDNFRDTVVDSSTRHGYYILKGSRENGCV